MKTSPIEINQYMKVYDELEEIKDKLNKHKLSIKLKELTKEKNKLKKTLFKLFENEPQRIELETNGKLRILKDNVKASFNEKDFKAMLINNVGDTSATRYIIQKIDSHKKEKKDVLYKH